MNVLNGLPVGFGMALAQNTEALARFGALPEDEQGRLVARAGQARSRAEMETLVQSLLS